jgi:hypothetical protein
MAGAGSKRFLPEIHAAASWEAFLGKLEQHGDLLSALPADLRALAKEHSASLQSGSLSPSSAAAAASSIPEAEADDVPCTNKLLQPGLEEGDILQLQWMRLDVSAIIHHAVITLIAACTTCEEDADKQTSMH